MHACSSGVGVAGAGRGGSSRRRCVLDGGDDVEGAQARHACQRKADADHVLEVHAADEREVGQLGAALKPVLHGTANPDHPDVSRLPLY